MKAVHVCSRSFSTRALDHARTRSLATATARHHLTLATPALAIVRARGFGTRLLSETTFSRLSISTRMASSAAAAAAVSERSAMSAQSSEARVIDGTLLAKYVSPIVSISFQCVYVSVWAERSATPSRRVSLRCVHKTRDSIRT